MDVYGNKKLGKVRLDLHSLATGPMHHDHAIIGYGKLSRLYFDIKMSQIIKINIRPIQLTCTFNDVLSSPFYSYNVNIVVSLVG